MKKESEKGITLVVLVITIIVLLILTSITVSSVTASIKAARYNEFEDELEVIQEKVNEIYEKNVDDLDNISLGTNIPDQDKKLITKDKVSEITDVIYLGVIDEDKQTDIKESFRYFTPDEMNSDFNLGGIEIPYLISFKYRYVIATECYTYENVDYYMIQQFETGKYNVQYVPNTNENGSDFEINTQTCVDNKRKIQITPKYSGEINKWTVKYKKEGTDYWQTSDDLTFYMDDYGTYSFKVVHGEIELSKEPKTVTVLPPIPNGFYYAGGDLTTGMVISDNPDDENKGTDPTTLIGNQFVWIPATEATYKREDSNTGNWEDTIENDYLGGEQGENNTFACKDELTLGSVKDFTSGDNALDHGINADVCSDIVNQIKAEKASVKKYGGFYFGRYEAGKTDEKTGKTDEGVDIKPVIKANVEPFTNLQWKEAYKYANEMFDTLTAKSNLVSSYAWDTIIDHIMNHATYENYATNRDDMNENWKDSQVTDSSGTVIKALGEEKRLKCRTNNTQIQYF